MKPGRLLIATVAAFLFAVPSAQAAFHLMKVSEVYPGATSADPNDAFIELQMFESGQNLVNGHKVDYYTATGALLGSFTMPTPVANGQSQRKILIGDTGAGAAPDFVVDQLGDALKGGTATGGAVCFPDAQPPDCVSWGSFTPQAGFPNVQSANALVIPDGQSLTRSTAGGCPNLLEPGDDTDNSAADFALTPPTPENNNSPLATECNQGAGGPPKVTIDKVKVKGDDAKVKFSADQDDVDYQCKLDKGAFKKCDSPAKFKNLDDGKHKVKVRATNADGDRGKAAKANFEID